MRISDWSSDVCSSDLQGAAPVGRSADLFQRAQGMASGKMLPIEHLATRDFNDRIAGERVNDTDAYAVQTHLRGIGLVRTFTPRMPRCEDNLQCGHAIGRAHV